MMEAGSILAERPARWQGEIAAGARAVGNPSDYGLDAMFPALFLALLVPQLDSSRRARAAALAAAVIALALTPFVPPGVPLIAAVGGAVLALVVRP